MSSMRTPDVAAALRSVKVSRAGSRQGFAAAVIADTDYRYLPNAFSQSRAAG
jgi:hypothetical protein